MKRVYFIKPIGMDGPIKIGNSKHPVRRCGNLAAWSPFPLEIVAEIDGDDIIEARFHRLFFEQHERLEWFSWSPALQDAIDRINAGSFDLETLPEYAGRLTTLQSKVRNFSALDMEYLGLLREAQVLRRRGVGFYHGRNPEIGTFAKIVSDDRKRRIIDGLRSFVSSCDQQDKAA